MANTNAPFGFAPSGRNDGSPWNDAFVTRQIAYNYATKIYRGDVVQTTTDGTIIVSAATGAVTGVFMGCDYFDPVQNRYLFMPSWQAPTLSSTAIVRAYVIEDPDTLFTVQLSGAITGVHTGTNVQLLAGTGNNTSGLSGMTADSANVATTATFQFKVVDFVNDPTNDSTSNYARIRVTINSSDYRAGVLGH